MVRTVRRPRQGPCGEGCCVPGSPAPANRLGGDVVAGGSVDLLSADGHCQSGPFRKTNTRRSRLAAREPPSGSVALALARIREAIVSAMDGEAASASSL